MVDNGNDYNAYNEVCALKTKSFKFCFEKNAPNTTFFATLSRSQIIDLINNIDKNDVITFILNKKGSIWNNCDNMEEPYCMIYTNMIPITKIWTKYYKPATPKPIEKPPLGLLPEAIWKENKIKERIANIQKAINNFMDVNKKIPEEWLDEYNKLVEDLKQY